MRALGRGGMGAVSLEWDGVRGEHVAMKRGLQLDPAARLRFKREFRSAERLLHPNLVRLHELGEDDAGLFFTMEAIDGVDLAAWCRGDGEGVAPDPDAATSVPLWSARTEWAVDAHAETRPSTDPLAATQRSPITGPSSGSIPSQAATSARGRLDLERLAHVLPQVVEALAFLHARGVVHRDLKPSNVIVRRDGVVKLLDFGILAELGEREAATAGTPGYMAPEQVLGEPAQPANDVYALGAVLFELCTGRPVYAGSTYEVLRRTVAEPPPRASDLAEDVPPALVEAIDAMLIKDPSRRPALEEVARALLPRIGARAAIFAVPRPLVVELEGRASECARLEAALARCAHGDFSFVVLSGPTGAGKSALAGWLAERAERDRVRVLRGRGRANDRVAFNALDGAIDELAMLLARRADRRADDPVLVAARTASSAFPSLAVLSRRASTASRRQAFAALVELFARVAERRGLLVWIDDLQWADGDSLALLEAIVDAAPPRTTMLATLRDDLGDTAASRWIGARRDVERIEIGPLGDGAVRAIVERAIARAGGSIDPDAIARIAETCGGRPFLAELAGRLIVDPGPWGTAERVTGATLDEAVAARLRRVDARGRDLLAAIVARDDWATTHELAAVVARPPGEVDDALRSLEEEGIVRRSGAVADVYHDAVRAGAVEALGDEALVRAHDRFASLLAEDPDAAPARRVRHLVAARREAEAALAAREAARLAEAQRAYGLAAEMYLVALRHPGEQRSELLRARAAALVQIGRYRDAADCYAEVAAACEGEAAIDATLLEAHARLAAHEVAEGRRRVEHALAGMGSARSAALIALVAAIFFLLGPLRRAAPIVAPRGGIDPRARARAARDTKLGMLIAYFDPLVGIRFLRRARAHGVEAGAADHVAWCDYVFAYYAFFGARRSGPVPLAARYLRRAEQVLGAGATGSPEVRAFPRFLRGVDHKRNGRWNEARAAFEEALVPLDEAGRVGTFEQLMVLVHRTQVDWYAQDFHAIDQTLARLRRASRASDDSAMRCHVVHLEVFVATGRGELASARDLAERALSSWPDDVPTLQRFLTDVASAVPHSFAGGDARAARARIARAFVRDARFRPSQSMYGGTFSSIAALVEARALVDGDRAASPRAILRHAARCRGAVPFGAAAAHRAAAVALEHLGRPDAAMERLLESEREADRYGQRVDLALARHARGVRIGGDAGATLREDARALLAEAGAGLSLLDADVGSERRVR